MLCGKHSQVENVAGAAHLPSEQLSNQLSVSILAQAISRSDVRCVCLASQACVVLSCPSVCNPVLWFLHFIMARVDDGSGVRISLLPASSLNVGEEKIKEMFTHFAQLPLLLPSVSSFEKIVQSLSRTVAACDAKITNVEQTASSFAARVAAFETISASASSGSGSASSWNWTVMAPEPLGPLGPRTGVF